MEQENAIPPGPTDFERADIPATAATTCAAGQHPLTATYYTVNGRAICQACREQFDKEIQTRGSFGAALLYGTGAAAAGATVCYVLGRGVGPLEGGFYGIAAVVVGVMVAKAVRRGASARTSASYRVLAMALTYIAMTAMYVPIILKEEPGFSTARAWVVALKLPALMLANFQNLLSVAILSFGLYEAYKLSAPPEFVFEGPFTTQAAPAPAPSPSAQTAAPV